MLFSAGSSPVEKSAQPAAEQRMSDKKIFEKRLLKRAACCFHVPQLLWSTAVTSFSENRVDFLIISNSCCRRQSFVGAPSFRGPVEPQKRANGTLNEGVASRRPVASGLRFKQQEGKCRHAISPCEGEKMLRKCLEILGLLEPRKKAVVLVGGSRCEPFDSLALIHVLSRMELKRLSSEGRG